jgi:hypothetical protein
MDNKNCTNCVSLAKLITFGDSKNYEYVCTLFLDKSLSDEPYVCRMSDPPELRGCEMFSSKKRKYPDEEFAEENHY